jgi:alpha-tubulin suppressor-like RCC1 family protein
MRTPPWVFQAWLLAGGAALTLGLAAAAMAGPAGPARAAVKPPCCRILTQSAAVGWGNNYVGELGDGINLQLGSPNWTPVTGLTSGVVQVSAGSDESLALTSDGHVWTWGATNLASPDNLTDVPVQVPGLAGITQVAAGSSLSLALRSDGTVWAWGADHLGDGTSAPSDTPVQVTGLTGITQIATAIGWSLALRSDGTVWSWGSNDHGQLGDGTTFDSDVPVQVTGLSHVTRIAAGGETGLAVATRGLSVLNPAVYAWGDDSAGAIGDGSGRERPVPVPVSGISAASVAGIAMGGELGGEFAMVLGTDGSLWVWGENHYGELGLGTTSYYLRPVEARGPGSGIVQVAADGTLAMDRLSDGTVWAWGGNFAGELGHGTVTSVPNPTPVQVTGLSGATGIAAGDNFALAIHQVPVVSRPS